MGLCTPHSNNLEKVTDFVIEQIKSRCKEFLDEEKYSNLVNTSKDKIEISENKEITIYYKFNILNMRKLENRLENVS